MRESCVGVSLGGGMIRNSFLGQQSIYAEGSGKTRSREVEVDQKQQQKKITPHQQQLSARCLATWLATFTQVFRQPIEEMAAAAYRETLASYSAEQIERGCRECLRTCKFFPKPAEIIEGMRPKQEIGDYAPSCGLLAEPPLDEKTKLELLAEIRGKLKKMPKTSRIVVVTDEMRAKIEAQKRKLGA